MADDKSKRGGQDRARVNGSEKYEVAHEAKKTGHTQQEVRDAAAKAGPMRKDVERELGKDRQK